MKKYLKYLLDDIEALIEQAPSPSPIGCGFGDEEDEVQYIPFRRVKICDLIGLPAITFPPEHLLSNMQVILLVEAINDLWSAWLLHWNMPVDLSVRKQYTALVREMDGEAIAYHPENGGDVHICQLSKGKICPFQPNDDTCHCRNLEKNIQYEFDLWEEYLRSQGLDPYQEITPEEEALFEEDMRHRRESKDKFGEDPLNSDQDYQVLSETGMNEEDQKDFLFALEMADELLGLILDNLSDYDLDSLSEDEGEDFEFPF